MSKLEANENNKVYLSIVQGSLRQSVQKGTQGAIEREWEAGGESGTKYEKVHSAATGFIKDISFFDGESKGRKFTNINIVLDENEEGKQPVLSTGIATRYASDILKKLPNINFEEEIRLRPYAFQPEGEDKTVTGVEITQRDHTGNFEKKITSFFHKKNKEDKWEAINGYPIPEGNTNDFTTDDWDIFYKQARKFLINYTKEKICTKFSEEGTRTIRSLRETAAKQKEEITDSEIPF